MFRRVVDKTVTRRMVEICDIFGCSWKNNDILLWCCCQYGSCLFLDKIEIACDVLSFLTGVDVGYDELKLVSALGRLFLVERKGDFHW